MSEYNLLDSALDVLSSAGKPQIAAMGRNELSHMRKEIDRLKGEVETVTKRGDWYKREYGKLLDEVKMLTAERGEALSLLAKLEVE